MTIVTKKKLATECVSWRWNGNLGDDLIYAAQEEMFGEFLELGQYVDSPDAVLVGGGTFVPKAPEHPELLRLSRQVPTALFGTGIGDPLFWGSEYIPEWTEILRNCRFIGVRGPLSKERLESWGILGDRIEWVGDPALYFARPHSRPRPFQGELAVNLGVTYGKLYGFDESQVEEAVTLALVQLARAGWRITLVCAWQPDDEVLERIRQRVPVAEILHWHDDYERALSEVSRFDVVVGEKLHVGVVAACRGVPFVALSYRSKVLDFCRSIDWAEFCVSTERLEAASITDRVEKLAERRDRYADRLQVSVAEVRNRLLGFIPGVVRSLQGE